MKYSKFSVSDLLLKRSRLIKRLDDPKSYHCMSHVVDLCDIEACLVERGVDIVLWSDY